MKKLKCTSCGSSNMKYRDGIWICNSCGSKYVPGREEIPRKSEEEKLAEKLIKHLNKQTDTKYAFYLADHPSQLDKYISKLRELADRLLRINPQNPYALAAGARIIAMEGYWSAITADLFISNIEQAVNNMNETERADLWEWLEDDLSMYKGKALELKPSLESKINNLEKLFQSAES